VINPDIRRRRIKSKSFIITTKTKTQFENLGRSALKTKKSAKVR